MYVMKCFVFMQLTKYHQDYKIKKNGHVTGTADVKNAYRKVMIKSGQIGLKFRDQIER